MKKSVIDIIEKARQALVDHGAEPLDLDKKEHRKALLEAMRTLGGKVYLVALNEEDSK